MILEVHASGPAATNCVLLGCEETRSAALIDAPAGCLAWVIKQIEKHHLTLDKLLFTHSHWDHTAEAQALKAHFSLSIYVHLADAGNLEKPGSDGLPLPFAIEAAHPDHFLSEGRTLSVGKQQIDVLLTPGHTPGGVCFWLPEEKLLISGDTLFQGTIGSLRFPTARPALMWTSLKRLAALPSDTQVIPGHGPATTIGDEAWIVDAENLIGP